MAEETGEREKQKKKILERLSGSRLNMIDQQSIEIFYHLDNENILMKI